MNEHLLLTYWQKGTDPQKYGGKSMQFLAKMQGPSLVPTSEMLVFVDFQTQKPSFYIVFGLKAPMHA